MNKKRLLFQLAAIILFSVADVSCIKAFESKVSVGMPKDLKTIYKTPGQKTVIKPVGQN